MLSCGFVEWPEGLWPHGNAWEGIRESIALTRPDVLITNELLFGAWLASSDRFDRQAAEHSVAAHEEGLHSLMGLNVPVVISSRPVWRNGRLANEAFAVTNRVVRPLHHKQFFPQEPGWHEATWYERGDRTLTVHDFDGIKLGVLLCTDLMFNEQARFYGRSGADLIAVPRASGMSHRSWNIAGAMAAIVSGSYVISSNRVGPASTVAPAFGGHGFAYSPDGGFLAETSADALLVVVNIDIEASRRQKKEYPCYVAEHPVTLRPVP